MCGCSGTEVADAHEAFWQHVQQEAPEELVHLQTHEALLVVMCRVAPAERDSSTINTSR